MANDLSRPYRLDDSIIIYRGLRNEFLFFDEIHVTTNVTTSGRNCNKILDVLTSKTPNTARLKHAFVCAWDFVL